MSIEDKKLKNILEAALMAVAKPMSVEQLMKLFNDEERPSASRVKDTLVQLQKDCEERGIELKEVATGFRYQARQIYSEWLSRLWEEKPAKYSRAYLETLALIAYRQPVTRAEIEEVRGVGVSSNIIRTMVEREWIRVVGHRDVPGRPSLYATTRQFLDYFNMKSLEELPSLAEIKDLDDLNPELGLSEPGEITDDASESVETESVETESVEAASVDAESVDAESVDAESVDAESVDAEPVDAESVDAEPVDAEPVDAESVDAESVDAEPVDAEPVEVEPIETELEFNEDKSEI